MNLPPYLLIGICALFAFVISKGLIPVLLLVSKRKNLFDDGNGHHKVHKGLIPTLGGIAIFTAFMVVFSASSFAADFGGFGYFVAASIILFGAGLKDDLLTISPNKKLAAQFIATALIIFGADIQFTNLGGVFGTHEISPWVGIPLTFFAVIVIINSINLIDGIDGLCGGIAVLASLFFGYWFYKAGLYQWTAVSFILSSAILGFLWYNRPPAKIFMGDTGSLVIGLYIAVLAIKFVEHSILISNVVYWEDAVPVIVAAVLVVPLYDTLRIFIVRMINGKSPFDADNDHVHHHLMRAGFNHAHIVVFLLSINVIILGTTIILSNYMSNTWLLVSLLSMCVLLFPTNRWKRNLLEHLIFDGSSKESDDTRESLSESEIYAESFLLEEEPKDSKEKVAHEV